MMSMMDRREDSRKAVKVIKDDRYEKLLNILKGKENVTTNRTCFLHSQYIKQISNRGSRIIVHVDYASPTLKA